MERLKIVRACQSPGNVILAVCVFMPIPLSAGLTRTVYVYNYIMYIYIINGREREIIYIHNYMI